MGKKFSIISERDDMIMKAINRMVWPRWQGKYDALKRACYYTTVAHRRRIFWICEKCGKRELTQDQREVDHIIPRMPPEGFDNLMAWIERTLCDADGLQILCEDCHHEKCAKEAAERAEHRRAKKLKARKARKKTRKVKRSKR